MRFGTRYLPLGITHLSSSSAVVLSSLSEAPGRGSARAAVGNAAPNPIRSRLAALERLDATDQEVLVPAIEGRACNAQLLQRVPRRQMRPLDQLDDLGFLGSWVSHASSPPSAIMLFQYSQLGDNLFSSRASLRSALTSSLVTAHAVSLANRFLPASRNSFDHV